MVTTVANTLFDRLIEAFPPNRSYALSDFEDGRMPAAVAGYLNAMMRTKLRAFEELPSDSWVDAEKSEVREARGAYMEALRRHQRIPADSWADTLRRASHETVRFLVQPASTLADAVFQKQTDVLDPSAIFIRLDYFTAYPYFRDVIEAYVKQKEIARIDRDRFEGLVNRIDRQMTSDYGPGQWRSLLNPLLEVLAEAGHDDEIPVDLLKTFLREKGAARYIERLKRLYGLEGVVPTEGIESIFAREDDSARRREPTETVTREQERGPVPLWKQFEQGHSAPEPHVIETSSASRSGGGEPLWKQFRGEPEADRPPGEWAPLGDVERTVLGERGARNRDLFVKHLFSGQRDEYEATLRRLERAGSWSHASQIIAEDVFLKHQVNIYSDPAVSFTDAAEAQYRS